MGNERSIFFISAAAVMITFIICATHCSLEDQKIRATQKQQETKQ